MATRNLLTGLFLVVAVATQGAMALSRQDEGSVTILAHGAAGLRIEGRSSQVSVEKNQSIVTFQVPIAPIETGIGLRDRHMRDILEADRFPAAVLRVSRADLTFPTPHQVTEGTAKGELTLHGVSRPVQVKYRAELGAGRTIRVKGALQLDVRDFEIRRPSYLGVTVAPDVQVEVVAELAEDAP